MVTLPEVLASEVALLLSVSTLLFVADLVSEIILLLVFEVVFASLTPEVEVFLLESVTTPFDVALLFLAVTELFLRLSLFP